MCALISMAIFSTDENKKDWCLEKTLQSLHDTVDFTKHRLMLSVNAMTPTTLNIIDKFGDIIFRVFYNDSNLGTAEAINKCWAVKAPWENAVKMDDDIVLTDNYCGWIDEMEEAVRRDPLIGQVGLKRKDCWENPSHPDADYKSELIMLPHEPGEYWQVVEKSKHIIGSCVMHSADLIDKVGALYQPSLYGYDDVIMSHRCQLAGFYSCFLPHIKIDHIDEGKTPYQDWKHKHSGEVTQQVIDLVQSMYRNESPIYYPFK